MINTDRMVKEFLELVQVDSLSLNERKMADLLKKKLESMGLEVFEDDAGQKAGGNTGNLISTLKGDDGIAPVVVMAHMDTVTPGTGRKAVVEGDVIKSDGTTVLGGDDQAGIACILEAVRTIKEENIRHGDIQIVFSIAEEGGLFGAKHLDYSKIHARYGFVMDGGGEIGTAAVKAPSQNKIDVVVKGKAAHAGVNPEAGVSAIQIAARAISDMKLGRIDSETTANVGIIKGGRATNIICDEVQLKAEARSLDGGKLRAQSDHMKACFEKAAKEYGGIAEVKIENCYPGYSINPDAPILTILKNASREAGVELKLEATGGGSDTNIINSRGIEAVDLSVGMDKVHSVEEQIKISDMKKAVAFLLAILKNVPEE